MVYFGTMKSSKDVGPGMTLHSCYLASVMQKGSEQIPNTAWPALEIDCSGENPASLREKRM